MQVKNLAWVAFKNNSNYGQCNNKIVFRKRRSAASQVLYTHSHTHIYVNLLFKIYLLHHLHHSIFIRSQSTLYTILSTRNFTNEKNKKTPCFQEPTCAGRNEIENINLGVKISLKQCEVKKKRRRVMDNQGSKLTKYL